MNKFLRNISLALLGLYGAFVFLLFIFGLSWNNKGDTVMWDKSSADWAFVMWLMLNSVLVYYCIYCYVKRRRMYKYLLISVGVVIVINTKILVFSSAEGDEVFYEFGVVHLLGIFSAIYLLLKPRENVGKINRITR